MSFRSRLRARMRISRLAIAAVAAAGVAPSVIGGADALAATANWNVNSGGNWSTVSNWSPFLPNGIDQVANFGSAVTSGAVTINQDVANLTVGGLAFNNANAHTISGANAITFSASGSPSLPTPVVDVLQGSHTISAPLNLQPNTYVAFGRGGAGNVNNTGTTLTLSGVIGGGDGETGAAGLRKVGRGTVVVTGNSSNTFLGPVVVEQGTLRYEKTGGTAVAQASGTLTIGTGDGGEATDAIVVFNQPHALEGATAINIQINGSGKLDGGPYINHIAGVNMVGGKIVNAGFYVDGTWQSSGNTVSTVDGYALILSGIRQFFVSDGAPGDDLVINAPIEGTGHFEKGFAGTMRITAANSFGGTFSVSNGTLILERSFTTPLAVTVAGTNSRLILTSDGNANKVIKTGQVNVTSGGRLDLTDNKVITTSPPGAAMGSGAPRLYSGVQGLVQSAYNFGAWDQTGLTTSKPDAVAGLTTIGVATGAQVRGLGATETDTFAGQTINGASTIAMYTYAGDANLDGTIDGGDYGIIDNFVQVPGADSYANGDFNYDGVIDGGDYGIIDNNIQAQGAPFPTAGGIELGASSGVAAVPEPACALALIGGGTAAALIGRRRRREPFPKLRLAQ